MNRRAPLLAVAAAAVVTLASFPARAQDWASSLYSEGGVELRVDERVFTLFAALNSMGFDEAPVSRKDPIPKREFEAIRQRVRDVVRISPALRAKFEMFFDEKPLPIRSYLGFTLALGEAPGFALDPKKLPKDAAQLQGFEKLLAEFHAAHKIGPLFTSLVNPQRDTLKTWSPVIDAPLAKVREILKNPETDESPRVVLVLNLLDGRGSGQGILLNDEVYLVVGPSEAKAPDVRAMVKAFARTVVQPAADGKPTALKGGQELLKEVTESGRVVGAATVADFVAENFARAAAIKAVLGGDAAAAALDDDFKKGFVLIKEMNRGLALYAISNKPLETFLADFLREIDAGKAIAQLRGS